MAFCANCGNEMSDAATACPNCGHPNEAMRGAVTPVLLASYAGWWRRFAARFIDGLVLAIPSFFLDNTGIVLGFAYHWLMIGLNDGRTLGKMAMGIRIAHPDGSKVSLGMAAGREAMAFVSAIALALGYIWAAFDAEKRTWHDMVVNTRAFHVS